jgi:hypothetical protein
MKKSQLRQLIRESTKEVILEQTTSKSQLRKLVKESTKKARILEQTTSCNSYQNRIPGDFSQIGPPDACASAVIAIRCQDIPSNYSYNLSTIQSGQMAQDMVYGPYGNLTHGSVYPGSGIIKIQGNSFPNLLTSNIGCDNGWTPVRGDHMLSHDYGAAQWPPTNWTAWLILWVYNIQQYCNGPRLQWSSCNPGWTEEGCLDPNMPNYSPTATADCDGNAPPFAPGQGQYGDESCCGSLSGCLDPNNPSYSPYFTLDCAGNLAPNGAGPFGDTSCCTPEVYGCTDPTAFNYNPFANFDDGSCVYPELGCTDFNSSIVTNFSFTANQDDGSCIYEGCTDSTAFNYMGPAGPYVNQLNIPNTTGYTGGTLITDNSSCVWLGCTDPAASNYDFPAGPYLTGMAYDDGNCIYEGCTEPTASNYDPIATVDDGSCEGCTDPTANNYNPLVTIDDGSCTYDVYGCTEPTALNYNPLANVDDGSCVYEGCTEPTASNYDPIATVDDGSCLYSGCTDPNAYNYDSSYDGCGVPPNSLDTSCCEYGGCTDPNAANYDSNADGCGIPPNPSDTSCCEYEGCTDPLASNYDPTATIDDGSCLGCTDPTATNYNPLSGVDDGSCEYSGCTDSTAMNYDPNADGCGIPPDPSDTSCCEYDPCVLFDLMSQTYQDACCTKCQLTNIPPNDPCYPYCDCCPEDERGCLDPSATNYMECCPPTYPGCVPNMHTSNCCNYEPNDYGWVCDVDPFVPLKEQWGPIPINSFACQPGTASNPGSYPTQILCQAANTNIPKGCGMSSQIQCSKCNNGYPISNMFSGPNCPPGWQLASLGNPCKKIKCYQCQNGYPVGNMFSGPNCPQGWQSTPPANCGPQPNDPIDIAEGVQLKGKLLNKLRMKTLSGIKKPK